MKIGIVTEYFYPTIGGITENIYHFALGLIRRGHDFRIITARREPPEDIDPEVVSRMIYIGRSIPTAQNGSIGRTSLGVGMHRRMREVLRSERFDIIHAHAPIFPMLPAVANREQNAPYVGTFHTCVGESNLLRAFSFAIEPALDRMAGRVAVSKCCAEEMERFFGRKFDVIPNGVDIGWWETDDPRFEKFDDGKVNILFLGRTDIRNGLDVLLHAYERVKAKRPNTRLIVVGGGPLLKYFRSSVPRSIAQDVHFEGPAHDTRPRYMKTADVLCFLPSIASFGITILEGMSAGKAMVASDIEPFRALVKDGESALLVDPLDVGRTAKAILRLVDDAGMRKGLGERARRAVEPYSWDRLTETQLSYYRNILRTGRGTPA